MRCTIRILLFLAAFAGVSAQAATQLLALDLAKGAGPQPKGVKSVAQPVRFNAAALKVLRPGAEVELTLPDASKHTFVFDVARDHGDGIYSWVGYYRDRDQRRKLRAVITTGPDGTFGSIQTPTGEWRLAPGRGHDWLVDMNAEGKLHEPVDLAGDAVQPPRVRAKSATHEPLAQAEYAESIPGITVPKSAKVLQTPTVVTVDVLFVYTTGLAAQLPGSQLQTRIAQLITSANTAYADSRVGIQLRNAGMMMVDYTDHLTSDTAALNDITYGSASAFAPVARARDDAGADLVTLLRAGDAFGGSGVAWMTGHAITGDDASLMYSVVSGCTQGCDWVWVHELGHNMGNAHDRATVAWEMSALKQPGSQGSFEYSYGFYTCNGAVGNAALSCPAFGGGCTSAEPQCAVSDASRNYADIMAYFHGSTRLMQFSNPDLTCADSGLPCGFNDGYLDNGRVASSNTALSMNNNRVALSAMRSVNAARSQGATAVNVSSNANPARAGAPLRIVATVVSYTSSGQVAVGEGSVQIRANGNDVGCEAVPVAAGTAECVMTLAAGTTTVTAAYSGTANYPSSPASAYSQAVVALPAIAPAPPHRVDLDGDGRADLGWRGPNGETGAWMMAGASYAQAAVIAAPAGATLRALADFDGDGRADALWRDAAGNYWIGLLDGANVRAIAQVFKGGDGSDVVAVGDFDGDGRADLLWATPAGHYGTWLMNGLSIKGYGAVNVPVDATVAAIGDFSGDRVMDIAWQLGDGSVGVTLVSGGSAGPMSMLLGPRTGWSVIRTADFDADGRADLLVAHVDGRVGMWLMAGNAIRSSAYLLDGGTGWSVSALADLDGDGRADILWTHAGDQAAGAWLMQGTTARQYGAFDGIAGSGWQVAATGDFNGDGRADIVFRRPSGEHAVWLMNGLQPLDARTVLGAASGWQLAPQ